MRDLPCRFPPMQYHAIVQLSGDLGISVAWLLRESIAVYYAVHRRAPFDRRLKQGPTRDCHANYSLSLSDEEYQALTRIAQSRNVTMAQIVRDAAALYVDLWLKSQCGQFELVIDSITILIPAFEIRRV